MSVWISIQKVQRVCTCILYFQKTLLNLLNEWYNGWLHHSANTNCRHPLCLEWNMQRKGRMVSVPPLTHSLEGKISFTCHTVVLQVRYSHTGSICLAWVHSFAHSINCLECLFARQALWWIQESNVKQNRQNPIKVNIYDIFTEINMQL